MPQIPTNIGNAITPNLKLVKGQSVKLAEFDALLSNSSKDNSMNKLVNGLLDNITNTIGNNYKASAIGSMFPFSSAFESTFGIGGPLPDFINMITAKLGLSAEKNQALQNIAINNKDATRTPESIRKIGDELKAAGIQYS